MKLPQGSARLRQRFSFNAENQQKAEAHLKKYPRDRSKSAVIPLLDLAQRQNGGWLSTEVIEYVATYLNMPPLRVFEVASFYSLFRLKAPGKYHIQICGTPPCWLCGSVDLLKVAKKWLGINAGDVTADGKFSLEEVECLGACTAAPVIQINDQYHENMTEETLIALLESFAEDNK
jgi:NADH-quinone oxidoreductase E subunit